MNSNNVSMLESLMWFGFGSAVWFVFILTIYLIQREKEWAKMSKDIKALKGR